MRRDVKYGSLLTINILEAERKSKKCRMTNAVADLPGSAGPVLRKINGRQCSHVTNKVADLARGHRARAPPPHSPSLRLSQLHYLFILLVLYYQKGVSPSSYLPVND